MEMDDGIRKRLIELCNDQPEDLARILMYLAKEEGAYENDSTVSPVWKNLRSAFETPAVFDCLARRLLEDSHLFLSHKNGDTEFIEWMRTVYSGMLLACKDAQDSEGSLKHFLNANAASKGAIGGFCRAMEQVSGNTQMKVIKIITQFSLNPGGLNLANMAVGLVNRYGATVATVGLAAVHLAYDAAISIYRWYHGKITGKRCAKIIIDSAASCVGGFAGGYVGANVGALLGPVGVAIGAVVGGIAGATGINCLSESLTEKIFDLPKEVALEKAYNFFGVTKSSANQAINTEYRKMCLKYHPDKGGDNNKFIEVQVLMQLIRVARGES